MSKLFSIDGRYKVTPEVVTEMNSLRKEGKTLDELSKYFKVSEATIFYWTDDKYREKQRLKNAKKRKTGVQLKRSIVNDTKKRRLRWEVVPQSRWVNRYYSAICETRTNRDKCLGISIPIVEKHIHKFHSPNSKINNNKEKTIWQPM